MEVIGIVICVILILIYFRLKSILYKLEEIKQVNIIVGDIQSSSRVLFSEFKEILKDIKYDI